MRNLRYLRGLCREARLFDEWRARLSASIDLLADAEERQPFLRGARPRPASAARPPAVNLRGPVLASCVASLASSGLTWATYVLRTYLF
jgi:hypothetical protein